MAGPSPVSALIHAATMVTAGVYLIARTNALFTLAPAVQLAVAIIGAAGVLVAGLSATTQRNIKRVLAYSTMSQLGYMFLALGVGAWPGAIFHLVTHAFFKSLLFLGAGVVILAMNHEHDIFAMGGMARKSPFTFWTFLVGAFTLAAIPPTTAGFSSKDLILTLAWQSGGVGTVFCAWASPGCSSPRCTSSASCSSCSAGSPRAAAPPRAPAATARGCARPGGCSRPGSRPRRWKRKRRRPRRHAGGRRHGDSPGDPGRALPRWRLPRAPA